MCEQTQIVLLWNKTTRMTLHLRRYTNNAINTTKTNRFKHRSSVYNGHQKAQFTDLQPTVMMTVCGPTANSGNHSLQPTVAIGVY